MTKHHADFNIPGAITTALRITIPFRFLELPELETLIAESKVVHFARGHLIMKQGEFDDRACYVMLAGSVEVYDEKSQTRVSLIETEHYFGEWEPIFDQPRVYSIRAVKESTCLRIEGDVLLRLLEDHTAFAQAMSEVLSERQGIFRAFELFDAELSRGVAYGHISIHKLLPLYQDLQPALHPMANSPDQLDLKALDYAIRRLPKNVSSTFAFLIRDEVPVVYEDPDVIFKAVVTEARRRSVWEILPGKDLLVTRTGLSDIRDFLTCLCVYATEARKIRRRIYESKGLRVLRAYLDSTSKEPSSRSSATEREKPENLLSELGFSTDDSAGLLHMWPKDFAARLWEIVNHREMFSVDVRTQRSSYNLSDASRWSTQISEATRSLVGFDPVDLPQDCEVHIISSNTHSVTNCLNPWYAVKFDAIFAWAKASGHAFLTENWDFDADCLYALARDYFKAHPGEEQAMYGAEKDNGILRLTATAGTGIEVQVIDLDRITGKRVDPILKISKGSAKKIIVNIDFAFGEQAQYIIHQLILLFGHNIKSVNLLGKAGALTGKRGDILIPTAFLDQSTDLFMPVTAPSSEERDALDRLVGPRHVHQGTMLTVKGTLLQNRLMLNFYKRLWKSQGIEMEGFFYHRQVVESLQTGLLDPDTVSRFYYYVSDLPLDTGSNLSERLRASEGIPPLYAITRQVLSAILG